MSVEIRSEEWNAHFMSDTYSLKSAVFEMQVALCVHCRTNDELSVVLNADLSTVLFA